MKRFIVLDNEFRLIGSLADKYDAKLFKQQRDINNFNIVEISERDFKKKFGDINILTDRQAFHSYGYLIFPDEELFIFEDFDYKHTNFSAILANFLRDSKPFIKFQDDELETVELFLGVIHSMLEESEFLMHNSEDEVYEHDTHFRMDRLTRDTVAVFGGRK
jgi:hypothetical protein